MTMIAPQSDTCKAFLEEHDPEALLLDGFDEALVGVVRHFSRLLALYDYDLCVGVLEAQGASNEEAVEYMEFNVVGAWLGEHTPVFTQTIDVEP